MKAILAPAITIMLLTFLCFPGYAQGREANWDQFRGPNGDGKSLAKNLPVEFGETQNVRWKTAIHGRGFSSPVVWDDQIWLTTAPLDGSELYALAIDLESGEIVHDIKVFDVAEPDNRFDRNSHATPTPVVEEGRVYVHFGRNGTACLDTKTGTKLWENRNFRPDECGMRPASSPIIDGDSLFVAFDNCYEQYVVALDKRTGETLWKKDREIEFEPEGPNNDENERNKAYSTGKVIEHEGRQQLISPAASATISYDPKTGEELWRVSHGAHSAGCRPLFEHGLVYIVKGLYEPGLLAIRPTGSGDVTDTHIAWSTDNRPPEISSPLIVDDLLFMVGDGMATCLEATSGREVWRERLGGNYWASPLYAAGKVYFSSKQGKVVVISASREFQLLAENNFDGGFNASPAVAGNALILRSLTHLYCISKQ